MSSQIQRRCQPCTACCDGWVRMVIEGVAVYPGHPCPHSNGQACDDYLNRPVDPCHNFICGWVQTGSPLPEDFRPDKAGVIVLPDARRWQNRPVDVAVPVGRSIPDETLDWLKGYAMQEGRPLIYLEQDSGEQDYRSDQNLVAYGPPEFQNEIRVLLEAGNKLW